MKRNYSFWTLVLIAYLLQIQTGFAKNSLTNSDQQSLTNGYLEVESVIPKITHGDLILNGEFSYSLNKFVAINAYFYITTWGQAYIGFLISPNKWLSFGFAAGIIHNPIYNSHFLTPRLASVCKIHYKWFHFSARFELDSNTFSGDTRGVWYKIKTSFDLTHWMRLTTIYLRPTGLGGGFEFHFKNFELGIAYLPFPSEPKDKFQEEHHEPDSHSSPKIAYNNTKIDTLNILVYFQWILPG